MTETVSSDRLASPAPPAARRDRIISVAVNLIGVALVAAVAYALGSALYEGAPERLIALAGIAAVATALILAPDFGLLLWMALAPFGRLFNISMGQRLPDLSLTRVAALSLLLVLLMQAMTGRRKLAKLTAVEYWGIAFILAMVVSIAGSRLGWIGGIQNVFDYFALPLLCFYFARNVLRTPRHAGWVAVTFAIIGATLGIIAAREQLTNVAVLSPLPYRFEYGLHSVKVTSLFGSPSIMAMTLAMTLPYALVGAIRSSGLWPRLLWGSAILAIVAGLLLTYVRAGWLAAALSALIVVVLSRRARVAGLLVLLTALLIALAITVGALDFRAIQERTQAQRPIDYRRDAISVGLRIAAASPITGLGLDNYSDAAIAAGWRPVGRMGVPAVAAHNAFIYIVTSGGLLALIPLLGMLAAIALSLLRGLRNAQDDRRDWLVAGLAMFLSYVLIANTIDAFGAQVANMLFFLALGATFSAVDAPVAIQQPAAAPGEGAPAEGAPSEGGA